MRPDGVRTFWGRRRRAGAVLHQITGQVGITEAPETRLPFMPIASEISTMPAFATRAYFRLAYSRRYARGTLGGGSWLAQLHQVCRRSRWLS